MAIRVIIVVPVNIRAPWITPIGSIVIAVTRTVKIVPVIQFTPAGAVLNFHAQVSVIVIIFIIAIRTIIIVLYPHILVMINRTGRRIINVIGGLTGFVSGGTIAKSNCCKCQE